MTKKFWLSLLIIAWISSPIYASAQEFIENVNYIRLAKPQPVQTGEKIEVLELFWYHCPNCYRLEPFLNRWLKDPPEYVEYIRVPAILTKSWELDARVFYTLEALGATNGLHESYFDAIHKERKPFVTEEQVANWAGEHGVDKQMFLDTFYNSFYVFRSLRFKSWI